MLSPNIELTPLDVDTVEENPSLALSKNSQNRDLQNEYQDLAIRLNAELHILMNGLCLYEMIIKSET